MLEDPYIKSAINFIKTYSKIIIEVLIVVCAGWSIWKAAKIISETPQPAGAINIHSDKEPQLTYFDKSIPKDFYFFEKIGAQNTTTYFDMLEPKELAEKCMIFKNECIGFDSQGNLVLGRDKDRLRFVTLSDDNQGYYRYLESEDEFKEACEKNFGGEIDGKKCKLTLPQAENIIKQLNLTKENSN